MGDQTTYLGVGLYSYADAARIIGIAPAKLRRWVRDYEYFTHGFRRHHQPVIPRYLDQEERVLTFLELIELLFVALFRREGVSLQAIRLAAERAARLFATNYPFAVRRFSTDGKRIFATLKDEAGSPELMAELGRGQLVFPTVIQPYLRKIEYHGDDTALKFWPMERKGRVVLDPERAFGEPIDAETGVPTIVLYKAVQAEGGEQAITDVEERAGDATGPMGREHQAGQ